MRDAQLALRKWSDERLAEAVAVNLEIVNEVAPTIATMTGTYDEMMDKRLMLFKALERLRDYTLEQYIRNNNANDMIADTTPPAA